MITNLLKDFNSLNEFIGNGGGFNSDIVEVLIPKKNTIELKNKKNDNSLNITIFRNSKALIAGRTYTISCDFEIEQCFGKSLPNDVPKIAFDGTKNGKNIWDIYSTLAIPNEVGCWHRTLTVTVPNDFSAAWFRIHCGIENQNRNIIIRNILITESNFEFDIGNNLFEYINGKFILKDLKNISEEVIYKSVLELCKKKNFKLVEEILFHFEDNRLVFEKIEFIKLIVQKKIDLAITKFNFIIQRLSEKDEWITAFAINQFAIFSKWEELNQYFKELDTLLLFPDNIEILYQKAQTARRLKNREIEQLAYDKALFLDNDKANIDWELFFDNANPGLTYRREELKFILSNFNKIQKIANTYKSKKIDITESPVFVYWDQGLSQAPKLVQVLVRQMKRVFGERLVVLSYDDLELLIDIPSCIRKFRDKYRAFFSDYIRVALLMKFGGIWLDSTVLVNKRMADEINTILKNDDSNLYVLRVPSNPYRISNWFLSTNSINNRIMVLMYAALVLYWEEHDSLYEYYQFHSFFEILSQLDNQARSDFEYSLKNDYQIYAHDLLLSLRDDFDEEKFKEIMNNSPIQKLTYKANLNHLRSYSTYNNIMGKILLNKFS